MSQQRIQSILSPLAGILPLEKMVPGRKHRFLFPFWHAVSDIPPAHLMHLYRVPSVSDFVRDIDFFLKNFRAATTEQLIEHAYTGNKSQEKYFFPTFDDGLSECFHQIAPILKKRGISAAFFINPEFVDNKILFHRHKASLIINQLSSGKASSLAKSEAERILQQQSATKTLDSFLQQSSFSDHSMLDQLAAVFEIDFPEFLAREKPYMTLAQIKQMQSDGFLIGAHGLDHREFYHASASEIIHQISSSIDFLMKEINPPIKSFAFPFTDFGVPDSVFEQVLQAGLWDLSFGTAGIKDDIRAHHLQRIPMEAGDFTDARQLIRTEYLAWFLKKIIGKNKVRRQ
ncbi:MAG: polysaccharide deacetylase family protein [Prolixibacteraceae bacterium]|jgi:peptidoglycan/xylan/chitin deacetylase (PgdA/CDA1 family)